MTQKPVPAEHSLHLEQAGLGWGRGWGWGGVVGCGGAGQAFTAQPAHPPCLALVKNLSLLQIPTFRFAWPYCALGTQT